MRGKRAPRRIIEPDPVYQSRVVAKFINRIMIGGKKTVAQGVVYGAFDQLKEMGEADPMVTFETAMRNVAPRQEVKSRRVGGSSYQVPIEVAADRGIALAMRWVVQAAKGRSEKTMALRLAAELYDAYLGRGASIKTRDDVHRMAKANQAFAHYRW